MNRAKNEVRIFILAVALLFIYSVTCKAQDSVLARKTYTIDVPANGFIKKTDLKLNEGDIVHLKASGIIVLRGVTGSSTPEGIEGFVYCRMDQVYLYGALLYKIGEDDWNIVDPQDTIVAERTGYLKFMVNDNDPSTNRGSFTVKATVVALAGDSGKIIATRIEAKRTAKKTSPRSPAVAGSLTLSDLQKACGYSLSETRSFLTSKQFRFDDQSTDQTNKYSFSEDKVTASVVKDARENQTTFETSSADNYEKIKESLDEYGYTHRKLSKKVEGVGKYANSNYSLSIVTFKINNKRRYLFVIKKTSGGH